MIRRCTLVAVGKPKGWAAEASEDYAKRLRRYFPVNIIEVAEEDMNRRSHKEVLSAEGERILKRLPKEAYVISLDREKGKQHPSEETRAATGGPRRLGPQSRSLRDRRPARPLPRCTAKIQRPSGPSAPSPSHTPSPGSSSSNNSTAQSKYTATRNTTGSSASLRRLQVSGKARLAESSHDNTCQGRFSRICALAKSRRKSAYHGQKPET